jgi:hypothetical protein
MPSVCTITLTVNIPPSSGIVVVKPKNGRALMDNFIVSIVNEVDDNTPLTYKYMAYLSPSHM